MAKLINVLELSIKRCKRPIQGELVYATPYNFVGRVLDGYHAEASDLCLLTPDAANAVCDVQNYLIDNHNVGLFIFDAYRPKRTVQDFLKWSKALPVNKFELERKALHYPHIEKSQLFSLGYLSEDSNHCYGNTVDLVLVDAQHNFLNMGAIFDFLDEISHLTATADCIGQDAFSNRQILIKAMTAFGFESYVKEFWHFCHGGAKGREVLAPIDISIHPEVRDILIEV